MNSKVKEKIKLGKKFTIVIKAENYSDTFNGYGHQDLTLLSKKDMVFRKSEFTCDRTVLIKCSKSSNELNRLLIKNLNTPKKKVSIIFKKSDLDERSRE